MSNVPECATAPVAVTEDGPKRALESGSGVCALLRVGVLEPLLDVLEASCAAVEEASRGRIGIEENESPADDCDECDERKVEYE